MTIYTELELNNPLTEEAVDKLTTIEDCEPTIASAVAPGVHHISETTECVEFDVDKFTSDLIKIFEALKPLGYHFNGVVETDEYVITVIENKISWQRQALVRRLARMKELAEIIKNDAECILDDISNFEGYDNLFAIERAFDRIRMAGGNGYDVAMATYDELEED